MQKQITWYKQWMRVSDLESTTTEMCLRRLRRRLITEPREDVALKRSAEPIRSLSPPGPFQSVSPYPARDHLDRRVTATFIEPKPVEEAMDRVQRAA